MRNIKTSSVLGDYGGSFYSTGDRIIQRKDNVERTLYTCSDYEHIIKLMAIEKTIVGMLIHYKYEQLRNPRKYEGIN